MKKYVCIFNEAYINKETGTPLISFEKELTIGKSYEVVNTYKFSFLEVENDQGCIKTFVRERFVTEKEWYDKQFNKKLKDLTNA